MTQQYLDAFGKPLSIGDTASYVYNDTSFLIFCRVEVVGFTPQKVKIIIKEYRNKGELDQDEPIKSSSGVTLFVSHPVGAEKAVMPYFLIKD